MDDTFEFLEQCELELVKQLCLNCPELSANQIDDIVKDFDDEINRQLETDGIIVSD